MIVVTLHKVADSEAASFLRQSELWLTQLSEQPGWISGNIARSVDEVDHWLIQLTWQDAGSCRRGLSKSDLRPLAFELAKSAISTVSTFEPLISFNEGKISYQMSARAADADSFSLGQRKGIDEV